MRAWTQLWDEWEAAADAADQAAALERYCLSAPAADAAWGVWLLLGGRFGRPVDPRDLRQWVAEHTEHSLGMIEICYQQVGDLAEALALLLPAPPPATSPSLAHVILHRVRPLASATPPRQRAIVRAAWAELTPTETIVWHKFITGGWRLEVPRAVLAGVLAKRAGVDPAVMELRLRHLGEPDAAAFERLIAGERDADRRARPYPFCPGQPCEGDLTRLGDPRDWHVEWRWPGPRAQLWRRGGDVVLWSEPGEVVTPRFPEVAELGALLPDDTTVEGFLVAWRGQGPLPFTEFDRRWQRATASKQLQAAAPVTLVATDLLEHQGTDVRVLPWAERRASLESLLAEIQARWIAARQLAANGAWTQGDLFGSTPTPLKPPEALRLAASLAARTWEDVAACHRQARSRGASGLILRRRSAPARDATDPAGWWDWPAPPLTCLAVLAAVQLDDRSSPPGLTDLTLGVWCGPELKTIASVAARLPAPDLAALREFVATHTVARFGPVRTVQPAWVFELAFDAVARSGRFQSGLTLQNPRLLGRRAGLRPEEAAPLEHLVAYLVGP